MTPTTSAGSALTPERGIRGRELDLHVTFAQPLPEPEAIRALQVLDGFTVELYRPHPLATGNMRETSENIPAARVTGPLRDPEAVRAALRALLTGPARTIEGGERDFLRSASGQTEWMPWRRNRVLARHDVTALTFEPGIRYVLE